MLRILQGLSVPLGHGPTHARRGGPLLEELDRDHDGKISVQEIQKALSELVGLTVDERELTLAKFVHDFADTTGNGEVTLEDLEMLV